MKDYVKVIFEFYSSDADELIQKIVEEDMYTDECIGLTIEKNDKIIEKRDFRAGEAQAL